MRLLGSALRLTAATVLVAAVGLVLPAGPASAAACSSADGVSVVVDFHQLGGGVQTACVPGGGGKSGASLFTAAGFGLTYVQRQPGFVCRVNGAPASDPCVNTPPADAYWGLWWSDGESGRWTYATRGVTSQTVPDGGYVALSWNGSSARSAPGVSPTAHPAAPPTSKPTSKPSTKPSTKPSGKAAGTPTKPTKKPSSSTSVSAGASTSPSASPSDTASSTPSTSPSEQPSDQPSSAAGEPVTSPESDTPTPSSATSDPADPADDGLPTWVGPVVVAVLFAAGGAVAVVRRRRNPAP